MNKIKSKEILFGSKALAEDIMQRLESLGIKRNEQLETMYDALDVVIKLAEFYKSECESAIDHIAEIHSDQEEEIDGTICFVVKCGCHFCEKWRVIEDEKN